MHDLPPIAIPEQRQPLSADGKIALLIVSVLCLVAALVSFEIGEYLVLLVIALVWVGAAWYAHLNFVPESRQALDVQVHAILSPTQLSVSDVNSKRVYKITLDFVEFEGGETFYSKAMEELARIVQKGVPQISREHVRLDAEGNYITRLEIRSFHRRKTKNGMQYSYADVATHMVRQGLLRGNDIAKRLPEYINTAEREARKKGRGIHSLCYK